MAAPAFVAAGTGAVITASSGTVGGHTPSAGNIVILQVLVDGASSGLSISGGGSNFESLAGTDGELTHITGLPLANAVGSPTAGDQYLGIGRALGGALTSGTLTTDTQDMYGRWYEFSGVHTGTSLSDVIENSSAGSMANGAGTGTSVSDTGVTTLGADRLACNFYAVNDDNAVPDFTGESGGDWTVQASFASATGTDGAIGLLLAEIASAGTINGGSSSMSASDGWGVVGFALIPVASTPIIPRLVMAPYLPT